MSSRAHATVARFIPAAKGTIRPILGDTVICKGNVAGSAMHFAMTIVPPGSGVPVHHHPSAETYIMVEGELIFALGEGDVMGEHKAGPGDVVAVPSGVWHCYSNAGSRLARFINLYEKSLEDFFEQASAGSKAGTPPSQAQIDHVLSTATAHGIKFRS